MRKATLFLAQHASWGLALAILVANFALVPAFQRWSYWMSLTQLQFATAALALALMPIVLTGGIDLSVGSVTVLSSVVIGFCWKELGWPVEVAILGGVIAGLLAGLANGVLVFVGVMPLVATLATRQLFRGLAMTWSGETPVTRFPNVLQKVWRTPYFGLPLSLYMLVLLLCVTYFYVNHQRLGRMIYAMGDNETAARFAGLPVRRIKLSLYAWAGLVAGMCGAALVAHYNSAKADYGQSLELSAIACLVIGGLRITGGAGNVTGAVLGIITLIALQAGLQQAATAWRDTITGSLLLIVALANEVAARWAEKRPY